MALLHVLTPHISADGVIRQSGDTYEDGNAEHVAQRLELGIVELVKGKKSKVDKTEDEKPADEPEKVSANLIED
jgi:hypothetical protein